MKFTNYYYLTEGGLGGHIKHPWEQFNNKKILEFFESFLNGEYNMVEKVDGLNLFIGFDKEDNLVFARNKTEQPSKNILKKFPITHPSSNAFQSGFSAIKEMFKNISHEKKNEHGLLYHNGLPGKFINLEIIYNRDPNVILYSKDKNYIVFHSMHESGSYEKIEDDTLGELVKDLHPINVSSNIVRYVGNPLTVSIEEDVELSNWSFKSSLGIPYEDVKDIFENIKNKYVKYPEYKKINSSSLSKDDYKIVSQKLTEKIGNDILSQIKSNLQDDTVFDCNDRPNIEGIVVNCGGNSIKITGSFGKINGEVWKPLRKGNEIDATVNGLSSYVLRDVIGLSSDRIQQKDWKASEGLPHKYMRMNGIKYSLNDNIDFESINTNIDSALTKLNEYYTLYEKDEENLKKGDMLKACQIAGYKVHNFRKKLSMVKNKENLLAALAETIYNMPICKGYFSK